VTAPPTLNDRDAEIRALVVHEAQYFADPFPAAPGRAALAEPIPAAD
jgi:hypothetical protein